MKHVVLYRAIFSAKKNVRETTETLIISTLKTAALLGRCPLTADRNTHERSFVSSEFFNSCIWKLHQFWRKEQTPI
jgi:hypothetical protein